MKVILSGIVGSQAYGLARPDSDIDMKGVYVADFKEVLGLSSHMVTSETKKLHEGDSEYHEVGKYISLALKVNPTIIEMLFLSNYETLTTEGQLLVGMRREFLSEPAIRGSYGAYAKAQADRLIRRNAEGKEGFSSDVKARTQKHGRHCIRLLLQGQSLLETGEMNVDVSDHKDWLFEMGKLAGEKPFQFYQRYQVKADEFDRCQSVVPQFPNRELANETLVAIRLASSGLLK